MLARLALVAPGRGRRRRPADRRRPDVGVAGRTARGRRDAARSTAATRTSSSPRWRPAPARSASLDLMLRTGPYGDGFGADPDGPHPRRAARQPARHRPRRRSSPACPRCCARPSGMIELAPEPLLADLRPPARPRSTAGRGRPVRARRPPPPALEQLVDAQRRGAGEGQAPLHPARPPRRRRRASASPTATTPVVTSRVGDGDVPVEVTDAIRPGVVSIPHGWGHDLPGAQLAVAGPTPA